MKKKLILKINRTFFDPTDPPPNPNPNPNPNPPNPGPQDHIPLQLRGKTSFTQEDVNFILSENKKKLKDDREGLAQRLEQLTNDKTLTEQQRNALAEEVEQIRSQNQTQEQ